MNRRNFIKGLLTSAAAVALPPVTAPPSVEGLYWLNADSELMYFQGPRYYFVDTVRRFQFSSLGDLTDWSARCPP